MRRQTVRKKSPRDREEHPAVRHDEGFANVHACIARRAYELYQARGGDDCHALDDWLQAEQEILTAQDWRVEQ
ncbi:MAG: hypothetical protein K0R44_213 [Thermomicrobiales bacterium]|nr:hypothetical protein [Thermomicrobiales bacterium]